MSCRCCCAEQSKTTFADIDVGDWFEDNQGAVAQRVEPFMPCDWKEAYRPANARYVDGHWARYDDGATAHPFEWEWVE